VRRLTEDDWSVLRDIRLRSVTEDRPVSASVEREQRFAETHWRMRARGSAWLVVEDEGRAVGVASLMAEPGAPADERHVLGLWVAPEARGTDAGELLLAAAVGEAWAEGAARVTTWRAEDDDAAAAWLRAAGFAPTDVRVPMPRDPGRIDERWVRERDAAS